MDFNEAEVSTTDAMTYMVNKLHRIFGTNSEEALAFLATVNDFREGRLEQQALFSTLAAMFKNHNEIIGDINSFLPTGYRVEVSEKHVVFLKTPTGRLVLSVPGEQQPAAAVTVSDNTEPNAFDAQAYVEQVRTTFQDQPSVFYGFVSAMNEYGAKTIDTPGVMLKVANLFNGHRALLEGFHRFLPKGYGICCSNANDILLEIPASEASRAKELTEQYCPVVLDLSNKPHDLSLPNYEYVVTQSLPEMYDPNYVVPLLPESPIKTPVYEAPSSPAISVDEFMDKVKRRFQMTPNYREFLEILHTYHAEQRDLREGLSSDNTPLNKEEVCAQVEHLFGAERDLLMQFYLIFNNGDSDDLEEAISSELDQEDLELYNFLVE